MAKSVRDASFAVLKVLELDYDDRCRNEDEFLGEDVALLEPGSILPMVGQVADLPEAEMLRCHMPTYSVSFHRTGQPEVEVSFCFTCDNARTREGRDAGGFTFKGKSRTALALLDMFRSHDPTSMA